MAKISINWLAAIGFSFAAAVASASPITLTVDPEVVNRGWTKGPFELNFSFGQQLHGVRLEGQTISHDFVFADNILARMLGATGGYAFDALLHLQTDADSWIGYFGAASTGFLLDADGAPLPGPYGVGRASSSDGGLSIGLFPNLENFLMSGAHYELVLPATGHTVTGGYVRIVSHADYASYQFGTRAQLPEQSSTLLLLVVAIAACGIFLKRA
jgi:hypothetical protein